MRKYTLTIGGRDYHAEVIALTTETARVVVEGNEYAVQLKELGRSSTASVSTTQPVTRSEATPPQRVPASPPSRPGVEAASAGVTAPLPGLIMEVRVKEGESVKAGQTLMVMEAMKMENQIQAPHDGTVKRIYVKNDDTVAEGDPLVELARPPMTTL